MSVASVVPKDRPIRENRKVGYNLLSRMEIKIIKRELDGLRERLKTASSKGWKSLIGASPYRNEQEEIEKQIGSLVRELRAHSATRRKDCMTGK